MGQTITIGSTDFPAFDPAAYGQEPRTYSIAATVTTGGLRKFVDGLPGLSIPALGVDGKNNLGQELPVAVPDTTTYSDADYYEIGIIEWTEKMHSDLPKATKLRGYVQLDPNPNASPNFTLADGRGIAVKAPPHYLGPVIVAKKNIAVRLKVKNLLPVGQEFFIPVDTTVMGAGKGNKKADGTPCDPLIDPNNECLMMSEGRVGVHLHGGFPAWISDGTPHQWIAPAGEKVKDANGKTATTTPSSYLAGESARDVPDMNPADSSTYIPANGEMTLHYPNQQSGRLMFYHDHAYGLTRLNVYGGVAAGYLLTDDTERALTPNVPDLPLVIQDKTFVPTDIATQDSKWSTTWGQPGDLWYPHIYEANQDPICTWGIDCMNPLGRWDYGPYIWPPQVLDPVYSKPIGAAMELPKSVAPEAFMDVMMVNGTVYPVQKVEPKAYRLRILNASNDRFLNLQLYYGVANAKLDPTRTAFHDKVIGDVCDGNPGAPTIGCTEVAMVPRNGDTYTTRWNDSSTVPFDGRPGGVPNPVNAGPKMLQIGTESGLLPKAVMINNPPIPVTYDTDPKSMTVGNVIDGTLRLGPAERADIVVDFSGVAPGSKLVLYNDAPAAYPAGDQRYDYYTFGPDWTANGGAASPQAGFGPNTRTIMQFDVQGTPAQAFDLPALATKVPAAYATTQDKPLVPEPDYDAAFGTTGTQPQYAKLFNTTNFTYSPSGLSKCQAVPVPTPNDCVSLPIHQKAIAEEFDPVYGRMSAVLGTEAQVTGNQGQNTFGFTYVDPTTEVIPQGEMQIWKLTHNGVDTHAIHFHLLNVQIINRVDWAGVISPPDPNELGWKETVRMNPLEDIILAVRANPPKLPFTVPDSNRLRDQNRPANVAAAANLFNFTANWPYAQPEGTTPVTGGTTTFNDPTSYSWEYVWHCHLLGHEENDMMRSLVMTNVTNYNTADTFAPTIEALPAAGAANFAQNQAITLTVTDEAVGRAAYLNTGVASITYTVKDAASSVVASATDLKGNKVGSTVVTINPPVGGWPLGTLTVDVTAKDGAANPLMPPPGANTATQPFLYTVINLDNTPPTLTWGTATPAANVRGWNNTPVSIPFTATDTQSLPVTAVPPNPLVIATEGLNQTGTVTVSDAVGNSAAFTSPSNNIDLTPPVVTNTSVSPPSRTRANGTSGVIFAGSATDALSGLFINPNANEGTYRITNNKSTQVLTGTFNVTATGTYSFTVNIPRSNTGTTRRVWTATISVRDRADNVGSATATYIIDPQLP